LSNANPLPFATVAVPTRNEAATIEGCLRSLVAQDYPHDRFEVLVLDGGSTDGTPELVERFAAGSPLEIRLVANPRGHVPAALNIALAEARGEYLVRVDGHSHPEPRYLSRSIAGNLEHGADLAGGWVRAVGEGAVGRAVAAAFASPFSMGNPGSWNAPDAPREVASVPCGSYRLEALKAIGGFDEGQLANQDYEANYRLRAAGGKVVLLPDVHFDYVPRDRLSRLARQFARYGYYKARTMAKHPASIRPRHLVPAAALVGLGALVVTAAVWAPARPLLLAAALAYLVALVAAAVHAGRGLGRAALALPAVFATMHLAWGAGNVLGLARFFPRRSELRG